MLVTSHNTERFSEALVRLNRELEILSKNNLQSQAVLAEDFFLSLLNALYGWKLTNANAETRNAKAVDLIGTDDVGSPLLVQVTVTCTRDKVRETLAKAKKAGYAGEGCRIKFAFVGKQNPGAMGKSLIPNEGDAIFDQKRDLLFSEDLVKRFMHLEPTSQDNVLRIVELWTGMHSYEKDARTFEASMIHRINSHLIEQRDNHPSFVLMNGSPDEALLPKVEPIPNRTRRASVDGADPILLSEAVLNSWSSERRTHLLITGRGGVGKTVALLTFATEEGFLPRNVPAVYIPLCELAQYHEQRRDCIDTYLRNTFPKDECDFLGKLSHERRAASPSLILLLDGHNEIPVNLRDDVDRSIKKWAERGGTQVVTTSRIPSLTSVANTRQVDLRGLSKDEVSTYLTNCGVAKPDDGSNLWQVLETPLMLKLYIDVETFKRSMSVPYINLEEPYSAGCLVWNYLQRELWRVIKLNQGDFTKAEYVTSLLLTLPYVCWRMESEHELKITANRFEEYVHDACDYWASGEKPKGFLTTERRLHSSLKWSAADDLFNSQLTILSDETGFLSWNNDGYSLLHQNLRDGLAALHLRNVMERSENNLPEAYTKPISRYVRDFLIELVESNEWDSLLLRLWGFNRQNYPTHAIATHNLLCVIHGKCDGDLSTLDWTCMNLHNVNLFGFRNSDSRMVLSRDKLKFDKTVLRIESFLPQGHSQQITSVCYSSDGSTLASGSYDGTVRLWEVTSGRASMELRAMDGHDAISSICLSPDGRTIAGGSTSGRIHWWHVATGREIRAFNTSFGLNEERREVVAVCFSPDGSIIAGVSGSGHVILWSTVSSEMIGLRKGQGEARAICISPDGSTIATGFSSGRIKLWSMTTLGSIAKLGIRDLYDYGPFLKQFHLDTHDPESEGTMILEREGWVTSVCYSPDGTKLVSGYADGAALIWDVEIGREVMSLFDGINEVWSVCFSSDGSRVATSSSDGVVRIWDASTGELITKLEGGGRIDSVLFSPDDETVAGGLQDGTVRLWDVTTEHYTTLGEHHDWATSTSFSPNGSVLASGSTDGSVRLWDVTAGTLLKRYVGCNGEVSFVAFSPDGTIIAGLYSDGSVLLWDVTSGFEVARLERHPDVISSICFSPDGTSIISGSLDGSVRLWDVTTGRERGSYGTCMQGLSSIALNKDGTIIAGGCTDGSIHLWDRTTGYEMGTNEVLQTNLGTITSICFSPDGSAIALGLQAGQPSLCLLDMVSGKLSVLDGGSWGASCVCFTPSGETIAYVSRGFYHLIHLHNRYADMQRTPVIKQEEITSVCLSPDGHTLAYSSTERIAFLRLNERQTYEDYSYSHHIVPLHGIDISGIDFSLANIGEHDRNILRQNGAKV